MKKKENPRWKIYNLNSQNTKAWIVGEIDSLEDSTYYNLLSPNHEIISEGEELMKTESLEEVVRFCTTEEDFVDFCMMSFSILSSAKEFKESWEKQYNKKVKILPAVIPPGSEWIKVGEDMYASTSIIILGENKKIDKVKAYLERKQEELLLEQKKKERLERERQRREKEIKEEWEKIHKEEKRIEELKRKNREWIEAHEKLESIRKEKTFRKELEFDGYYDYEEFLSWEKEHIFQPDNNQFYILGKKDRDNKMQYLTLGGIRLHDYDYHRQVKLRTRHSFAKYVRDRYIENRIGIIRKQINLYEIYDSIPAMLDQYEGPFSEDILIIRCYVSNQTPGYYKDKDGKYLAEEIVLDKSCIFPIND